MQKRFLNSVIWFTILSLIIGCGVESTNQTDSTNGDAASQNVTFSGTIIHQNGSPAGGVTIVYAITGDSSVTDAQGHYNLGPVIQSENAEFIVEDDSFSAKTSIPLTYTSSSEDIILNFTISADKKSVLISSSQLPNPSPTPGSPSNSDSPFDKDGNTKSFGIPSGMVGNAHKGKKIYFGSCSGCHASVVGKHASYASLSKSLSRAPMDALHISRENTAHLVAYLNFIK